MCDHCVFPESVLSVCILRTQMMIVRRESMETITADEAEGNNKGTALAAWRGEAARRTGGERNLDEPTPFFPRSTTQNPES